MQKTRAGRGLKTNSLRGAGKVSWRWSLIILLNVSLCHQEHLIADLRARATDLLYSIVKYCLDVVSDAKAQTDLVSGLKEKELFPDLKFSLQYSNHCCVLLNDENHSYNDVIRFDLIK